MILCKSVSIREAATHLSKADCLDEKSIQEFGNKLEESKGKDWSTVTADQIEELGVLVGM